jgi:nitroimidazol reductase NimA-like FMN-containing flavoprotein (pyridoxamine 5'-phosphate oxidase superfamily)
MTAEEILAANRYMTLSTADASGVPWASPVWFAWAGDEVIWVSYEHRRHSRNIAERPQVAIVVFDSSVTPGDARAVYMEATAARLEGDERAAALDLYARRCTDQGIEPFTLADVEAENGLRLYRARVTRRWTLDDRDNRVEAPVTRA